MRKIFLCTLVALFTISISIQDAAAGRFGGRGFSSMRSNGMYSRAYNTKRPTATAFNRNPAKKMRGLFTGMLLGGLLTSLFMGHGFGSGLMSWLFLGLIVALLMRILSRKKEPDNYRAPHDL